MKKIICAIAFIARVYGVCDGMLVNRNVEAGDTLDFFFPSTMVLTPHPITLEKFESDSDSLYLSIDDFLEKEKLESNRRAYENFMRECLDLVPRFSQYRELLVKEVIPGFEKFATIDVPCEVTGFYDADKVNTFVSFLIARLSDLKKMIGG